MKILLAGGGTLGPVTPLVAVAEVLRERGVECIFVGTSKGPDGPLVRAAGFTHRSIPVAKFHRGFSSALLRLPLDMLRSIRSARSLVRSEQPDAVLGAGGFTSVPVGWAARGLGIPVVVHQQDVVRSLSNRILAGKASRITAALPGSVGDFFGLPVTVTGNPVRAALFDGDPDRGRARFGFDATRPVLLVVGGGTGATRLNLLTIAALPELLSVTQVLHVVPRGRGSPATHQRGYRAVDALTDDLPDALSAASAILCRGGFSTLSEIVQRDLPALVVPIPGSHQEANADFFAKAGAVDRVDQSSLTPAELVQNVRRVLARDRVELSKLRKPFDWRGAASAVAGVVLEAARRG